MDKWEIQNKQIKDFFLYHDDRMQSFSIFIQFSIRLFMEIIYSQHKTQTKNVFLYIRDSGRSIRKLIKRYDSF